MFHKNAIYEFSRFLLVIDSKRIKTSKRKINKSQGKLIDITRLEIKQMTDK